MEIGKLKVGHGKSEMEPKVGYLQNDSNDFLQTHYMIYTLGAFTSILIVYIRKVKRVQIMQANFRSQM